MRTANKTIDQTRTCVFLLASSPLAENSLCRRDPAPGQAPSVVQLRPLIPQSRMESLRYHADRRSTIAPNRMNVVFAIQAALGVACRTDFRHRFHVLRRTTLNENSAIRTLSLMWPSPNPGLRHSSLAGAGVRSGATSIPALPTPVQRRESTRFVPRVHVVPVHRVGTTDHQPAPVPAILGGALVVTSAVSK